MAELQLFLVEGPELWAGLVETAQFARIIESDGRSDAAARRAIAVFERTFEAVVESWEQADREVGLQHLEACRLQLRSQGLSLYGGLTTLALENGGPVLGAAVLLISPRTEPALTLTLHDRADTQGCVPTLH